MSTLPDSNPTYAIDPVEIAEVIDRLAERIRRDGNGDIYAPWAVATLASNLGVTVAIASSTDPVGVVRDCGEDWVDEIGRALDGYSGDVADVLRVAYAAIERIVGEVRRRGLAALPRRRRPQNPPRRKHDSSAASSSARQSRAEDIP